jgi:PAS domain S-box-containing protein
MAVYEDLTERKHTEESLRLSLEKYTKTFHSAPIWVVLSSLEDGRYIEVNDAFLKTIGYERDEVIGKTSIELNTWEDPEDRERIVNQIKEGGDIRNIEVRRKTRTGEHLDTLFSAEILQIAREKVMISVTQDITERKRAEADRERLREQLVQAQKMESVGRLAGGVAHDFNNMLGIIMGRAELAKARTAPSDPSYVDLEEIFKAAKRSADLTRQLLAFARRQTVAPKILDLNDTISGMLKMLRRLIGEDIDLVWMPGPEIWPVRMDPSQVDQILANLCVNARDAISDVGKITIETENVIRTETCSKDHIGVIQGRYVMLAVSDNGCGMGKDILDKLFEPFFTTKEVGKGTGLGLATVYGIVKQNSGLINVYSEPGQGTTFRIYLPAFEGEDVKEIENISEVILGGGGETVLLVEDEPMILEMGKMMLEKLGYNVMATGTPDEALQIAKEHPEKIHILMTDVVMPGMNGKELAGHISSLHQDVKVLFTSGYTANVIARHGVLNEGIHFIQKPFSLQDLDKKLREVLS